MPRSKKVLTENDQMNLKKQSERIKLLMSQNNLTNEKLAAFLDVSDSMLRYYRAGKYQLPEARAKKLGELFGVYYRYLTGETDCRTLRDYAETVERETRAGEDAYWREREQQEKRLAAMFSICGYAYRYDISFSDFSMITGQDAGPCGEHELIDQMQPNAVHRLSGDELHELISELRKHIAFFIYDKEATRHGHKNNV